MGRRRRKDTVNVAVKIETILKAEQPLEKPFVSGLSAVIGDVEALIAASETAITSNGLNFPADSQVYREFVTLIADFRKLTPVVEQAVSILEGKSAANCATGFRRLRENRQSGQPGAEIRAYSCLQFRPSVYRNARATDPSCSVRCKKRDHLSVFVKSPSM